MKRVRNFLFWLKKLLIFEIQALLTSIYAFFSRITIGFLAWFKKFYFSFCIMLVGLIFLANTLIVCFSRVPPPRILFIDMPPGAEMIKKEQVKLKLQTIQCSSFGEFMGKVEKFQMPTIAVFDKKNKDLYVAYLTGRDDGIFYRFESKLRAIESWKWKIRDVKFDGHCQYGNGTAIAVEMEKDLVFRLIIVICFFLLGAMLWQKEKGKGN